MSISKLGNNTYEVFPELQSSEVKSAFQAKENTYHRNNVKNILVKIKCGPNGLVFHADGIKSIEEVQRLNKYIEHIFFNKTDAPTPSENKKQTHTMFENSFFDDSDDDENQEDTNSSSKTDKDFQMMQIDECPPPPPPSPPMNKEEDVTNKKKSYDRTLLQALQTADPALFDSTSTTTDGKKTFARKCQSSRQPNVMNIADLNRNLKCFPDALKNHINGFGSDETKQRDNYYACAPVWCPKSRTAMSIEDFKKYNYKCPYPNIEEEPIKFLNPGDRPERVNTIDNKYPCCYNLKKNAKDEDEPPDSSKSSNKYILNESQHQLPPGRFGVIPESLNKLFDGKNCKQGSIQSSETDGYVRIGVRDTQQPLLDCLAVSLDLDSYGTLLNKINKNFTFLHFMSTNLYTYFITRDTVY